jgi:hypothetical protein
MVSEVRMLRLSRDNAQGTRALGAVAGTSGKELRLPDQENQLVRLG